MAKAFSIDGVGGSCFRRRIAPYAQAYEAAKACADWKAIEAPSTPLFPWDPKSIYIRRPPFASFGKGTRLGRYSAHPILVLGDDITTDLSHPRALSCPAPRRRNT